MDMSLRKLWEIVKYREPGVLPSMWSQRVGHNLVTEQLTSVCVVHTHTHTHTHLYF